MIIDFFFFTSVGNSAGTDYFEIARGREREKEKEKDNLSKFFSMVLVNVNFCTVDFYVLMQQNIRSIWTMQCCEQPV